jgi:predicted TIM-barrel fold metal-dependent hydrolase
VAHFPLRFPRFRVHFMRFFAPRAPHVLRLAAALLMVMPWAAPASGLPLAPVRRYVPDYDATYEDYQEPMRASGVTHAVIVQPSFLGTDNHLMLQALKTHPELLRGVAVVAADTPTAVLRDMHASGVRGIRLNLSGVSHDIPEWTGADALWQTLHDLGWHVEVHTDQGGLPHVLTQLPTDMSLVVDHMGKPEQARASDASIQALVQRATCAPTYVKLSGAYRLGAVVAAELAQIWLHALGPQA